MVSLAPTAHGFNGPWPTEAPQRRRCDAMRFAQQRTWRRSSAAVCTAGLALGRRPKSRSSTVQLKVVAADTCEQLRADVSAALENHNDVLDLLQEAIGSMPEDERGQGSLASDCVICVLEEALERKALKVAVSVYEEWRTEVWLPLSLRGAIMKILSRYGDWEAASSQVRELLRQEEISASDAAELFNEILSGMIGANHPFTYARTDKVIKEMMDIGVQPAADTLRLIVEAKTQYAAPGFLIDLGQSILEIIRRFDTALTSGTLLAISGAHLRTGDLDAAYRWFLASQLMEDRQTLDDAPTLDLVSQLARALAIGGRACELKRLLSLTKEDNGQLPQDVMSVSLSGYTCGQSLATCWFEPSPEVLRRRGIWASTPSTEKKGATQGATQVTCAEQWDWQKQETSRHEMYQWYPYTAPDTKLERAWLTPLRSFDRGSLGLSRQWAGQTPAEAAARERLQETGTQSWDLDSAIALEPPRLDHSRGSHGRPILLRPEPRTWRMHHADVVKKSYPTLQRIRAGSPAELREVLLAEKSTRVMFGAKRASHPIPHKIIKGWVEQADPALIPRLQQMKEQDVKALTEAKLNKLIIDLSDLSQKDIEDDPKLNSSRLRSILLIAIRFASGDDSVPLTDDEYRAKIMAMSDEDLEKAFQKLTTSVNDQILGTELTREVEAALVLEHKEDSAKWSGSAREELQLALEIRACLKDLGVPRLSFADVRAMLRAAHTLGDAEIANEVLKVQDSLDDETSNDLGPAGQALSKAMIQGGWDAETSKDFLKGKRLIPRRDGHSPLGQLQTRYVDPLFGLAPSEAASEKMLEALSKPFDQKLQRFSRTLPRGAATAPKDLLCIDDGMDNAVQWQVKVKVPLDPVEAGTSKKYEMVTKEVVVTQSDVIEALALHPKSAETLQRLCNVPQLGKASPSFGDGVALLHEMGLQVPTQQDKRAQLLKFVLSVLRSEA